VEASPVGKRCLEAEDEDEYDRLNEEC